MTEAHLFAIGITLAALAGVRAYLTVFGVGLAGMLGWVDLPPSLEVAQNVWVLGTAGVLTMVEFVTDKIPGVDSASDLLQTVLRVPVGAFLAAATLSPDGELGGWALAGGAGAALLTHLTKAGTRALINASPEPVSNWTASVGEDVAVVGTLALVVAHPWLARVVFVLLMGLGFALVFWLARTVMRRLRPAPR
jgi:uncharacterized membrane protein